MKICIYGNCQAGVVKDLLLNLSNDFSFIGDRTSNIHHITTWENILNNTEIDYDWVNKNCDIFLYQPIKKQRGVHSTDYILPKLRSSMVKVGIPFVFCNWLWPISMNPNNDKNGFNNNYTDININCEFSGIDFLKPFSSPAQAIEAFFHQDINFDLNNRLHSDLLRLKKQEANTDIKISDFIESKYKQELLFYRDVHPTLFLLKEIAFRVLNFLSISYDRNFDENLLNLNKFKAITGGYQPLSSHSFKELDLKFSRPSFFKKENELWKVYYKNLIYLFFNVIHLKK